MMLGSELRPSCKLGKHFTSQYIPNLCLFWDSLIKLPSLVIFEAPVLGRVGESLGIEAPSHIYKEHYVADKTSLSFLWTQVTTKKC